MRLTSRSSFVGHESLLATIIPLTVISTRFRIEMGLWFNDFLLIALAIYTILFYRPLVFDRLSRMCAVVFGYIVIHCCLFLLIDSSNGRSATIRNNLIRMLAVSFCVFCFSSFYKHIPRATALAGLRVTGFVLAVSVIIHFLLANSGLNISDRFVIFDEYDGLARAADLRTLGFVRAFGLASEPYWASAYLFIISCLIKLADPRASVKFHFLLLFAALLTAAMSLLLYLGIWIIILLRPLKAKTLAVVVGLAISFIPLASSLGMLSSYIDRGVKVRSGYDASANVRIGPGIRAIVATCAFAPLQGYGLGNSDQASDDGHKLLESSWLTSDGIGNFCGIAFIDMLASLGLPGLVLYCILLFNGLLSNKAWRIQLLFCACLLITANAYLVTHVQFYFFCILGQTFLMSTNRSRRPGWMANCEPLSRG